MQTLEFKNKYFKHASVEELHKMTRQWKSDLTFWKSESVFLYKLINKYFLQSAAVSKREHFENLLKRLNAFVDQTLATLEPELEDHEEKLAEFVKNQFALDEQALRETHQKLDHRIAEVAAHFRILKKEIFESVEKVM
jgi:hypothetical protein